MKKFLLVLSIIFSPQLYAQQDETSGRYKDTFVRVFDASGKKFAKGKITYISEHSLSLKNGELSTEIPMEKIHRIKTNHSAATNVLVGALAGVTIGAIIGATTTDSDDFFFTKSEATALGATSGGAAGAGIGGLTLLFRKGSVFQIQGSESAWEYFRESMLQ